MDLLNWTMFPWKSIELSQIIMFISIGIFFAVSILIIVISSSKKIRFLAFKCYFTYIIVFSENVLFLFILLWYVAVPLVILTTLFTYRAVSKEMVEIRDQELEGGWCCNFEFRKQQKEIFKSKSLEERQQELDFYVKHPIKLNPIIYIIFSILIPLAITLFLWKIGIGYRWSSYSLI